METRTFRVSGGVVCWSLGPTRRELLESRLNDLGLGELVPEARSDEAALSAALRRHCSVEKKKTRVGGDKILQRRKSREDGYEIVDVERGEQKNSYCNDFGARVVDGRVQIDSGYASAYTIQAYFDQEKDILGGGAVGKVLVAWLDKYGSVCLRDGGGVYWVPGQYIADWKALGREVAACAETQGKNRIQILTVPLDEDTIKAVQDGLTEEITAAATLLAEEVSSGTLRDETLRDRRDRAHSLHARIAAIEESLGNQMESLHTIVKIVEQAAAMATMQSVGV